MVSLSYLRSRVVHCEVWPVLSETFARFAMSKAFAAGPGAVAAQIFSVHPVHPVHPADPAKLHKEGRTLMNPEHPNQRWFQLPAGLLWRTLTFRKCKRAHTYTLSLCLSDSVCIGAPTTTTRTATTTQRSTRTSIRTTTSTSTDLGD